jgi:PIN domain nuclease of toxin-antitoxin system
VRYLLDTGVWLWTLDSVDRLNKKAVELLADGTQDLYFSAASSWEISIKMKIGKLKLPGSPATYVPKRLSAQSIQSLAISQKHALAVYDLPMHHADPFDRLLVAQARTEGMVLLTADAIFREYKVDLFWCGH